MLSVEAGFPVGQNVRVRKLLIGLLAAVTSLVVVAVGADFGAAIYAEYRWARSVRTANDLGFDPWVGILGFPFITQACATTTARWRSAPAASNTRSWARSRWSRRCTPST